MVIPSRWLAGGKGLGRVPRVDAHRQSPAIDRRLSRAAIGRLPRRRDSRAASATSSGTATIHGPCRVTTHFEDGQSRRPRRPLLEEGVRHLRPRQRRRCRSCKKVVASRVEHRNRCRCLTTSVSTDLVSSRKPFGLDTNVQGQAYQSVQMTSWSIRNGGTGYIARSSISNGAT